MAEFIRAKTTTFVNRPRGIISTNTGATEVGNAIAKLGSEIQDRAFKDAVFEQEKLGQETVMNLSVLDEDNNLVMRQLPTNLSQVARNTAEPLLRKKMANAIQTDTETGLADIRKTAKNEQEFKDKAKIYLDEVSMRMAETGGENYIEDFKNIFSKAYAQHGNDLKIKDGIRENEYHLSNELKVIENNISNIPTLFETNSPEAQKSLDNLLERIKSLPNEYMNVKQSGVNNLLDAALVAQNFGSLKQGIRNATSSELVKIQSAILSNGVTLNDVPDKYKESVKLAIDSLETSLLPDLNKQVQVLKSNADQIEQDAKLERNRLKPIRAYKATKEQQAFNNKIITDLQNANTSQDIEKIMQSVMETEKKNLQQIGNIGQETVLNNEKSMYQAITDGIKNNILNKITDITSKDINAIRQAIISNGVKTSGLREELVQPVKDILKATPDSLNNKLAQSFSQLHALVKQSEVETNKSIEEQNLNDDIETNSAPPTKKTNTRVEDRILNGKDKSYFYTKESLDNSEIDMYVGKKGYVPPTIVNQMQQLADENLTGEQQTVAINRAARYLRFLNPNTNNFQNKLTVKGGISAETSGLLLAALDVAEIKGMDKFNDILNNIKMRRENKTEFDNSVRMILHKGKSGDVQKYLRNHTNKLDYNVVNEMTPYVEYLISSGIKDKEKIDNLVTNFVETKFLPTNGIVADPNGLVNRSMYAIEAVLPDDELADQFLETVEDELPNGYTLNTGVISSSSSFFDKLKADRNLFFASPPTYLAIKGLGTAVDVAKTGDQKKAYLVPYPISPTNIDEGYGGEVIYYAMELTPGGELIPILGNNEEGNPTMYAWSTREVTARKIKEKQLSDLRLQEDRLKDDIGSEELAQEAINQQLVQDKITKERMGKSIMPLGAF